MRVLIADDKIFLRSALRLLLEHEGDLEIVGEVGSAGSLASIVAREHPQLLFLDWQLPGLNSNWARHRLTEELHNKDPELIIIALTDDSLAPGCLHLGADACVNRAESPDCIISTVRQAAARLACLQTPSQPHRPLN